MDNLADKSQLPSKKIMAKANVNPKTGLATDYLNLFNEYIMLAEAIQIGSLELEELNIWKPLDYESHFIHTGFKGAKIVVNCYRCLDVNIKTQFESATNELIDLIKAHKNNPLETLDEIKHQRDIVEAIIAGADPIKDDECSHVQDDIDALFD